ncbi:hypothetical protein HDU98_000450 [Podochytrium sp. JEL0797]|nr:hypothetical protein HDU98_000450 [Podochytrium sp. JEL0797]
MSVNHNNWWVVFLSASLLLIYCRHWIERNCLPWAKNHLSKKLKDLSNQSFRITSVASVEGQADINQRKGKLITVYDLTFVLTWKGVNDSGQISVIDFMHDTDMDELEVLIVVDNKSHQQSASREVQTHLIPKIKEVLASFSSDMLIENSKNLLNDTTPAVSAPNTPTKARGSLPTSKPTTPVVKPTTPSVTTASPNNTHQKLKTTTIGVESVFPGVSASDLYDSFLNPARVAVWSRDKECLFVPEVGREFKLFGGNVQGIFCEMVSPEGLYIPF